MGKNKNKNNKSASKNKKKAAGKGRGPGKNAAARRDRSTHSSDTPNEGEGQGNPEMWQYEVGESSTAGIVETQDDVNVPAEPDAAPSAAETSNPQPPEKTLSRQAPSQEASSSMSNDDRTGQPPQPSLLFEPVMGKKNKAAQKNKQKKAAEDSRSGKNVDTIRDDSEVRQYEVGESSSAGIVKTKDDANLPAEPDAAQSATETSNPQPPEKPLPRKAPSQEASSSKPYDDRTRQPPQPSLLIAPNREFASRPDLGSEGKRLTVLANHFRARLHIEDPHHYDVSISPTVSSRGLNRVIINDLVQNFRATHLGGRLPVYDGNKNLYTAGKLPFQSREFRIVLPANNGDNEANNNDRRLDRVYNVVIKFATRYDLHQLISLLSGNRVRTTPETLQVLDIVLRETPMKRYCAVGRSFFSPDLRIPLELGLVGYRGFYQSIRPTQMGLSLNFDISSTAFIKPISVIKYLRESQMLTLEKLDDMLSSLNCPKIVRTLKGVRVEVMHRGNIRSKYRISGLTDQATKDLTFHVRERVQSPNGTEREVEVDRVVTVVDYFETAHHHPIQHPKWPCLQVGSEQKPVYLPIEVCRIAAQQKYNKKLNENQVTDLLNATCTGPEQRMSDIIQMVGHNNYNADEYAREFGLEINGNLTTVEARILDAPTLVLRQDSGKNFFELKPREGKFNMQNKKMINGGMVSKWTFINFSDVKQERAGDFCAELVQTCVASGMVFSAEPAIYPLHKNPYQVERALETIHQDAKTELKQGEKLNLLIVILPEKNGPLYGNVKRICETRLGLVTQCCLAKNVSRWSKQVFANLALKINAKVGGRNTVLFKAMNKSIPLVSYKSTIVFGADVTHPHPGEDSSPSIAAVVASQDPEITKYAGLVCAQNHRQELIEDLYKVESYSQGKPVPGGMVRKLLYSFREKTKSWPGRIIFYRDGVSEGQFTQVLNHELTAIKQACKSLGEDCRPDITFVIVQKRHHTRLFPVHSGSGNRSTGNVMPGTVVDSSICHPTDFDFYLCSHAGIKGTSRPTHYYVLWDENNFTADQLQTFTNDLCYTYVRCTRAVSIVPPAYYAHLLAFRARFYMEPEAPDGGNVANARRAADPSGSRNAHVDGRGQVRPLPELMDNVQNEMFFC